MRSELDLVQEFSELNQAKIESFGSLPVATEKRWRELKGFYDHLLISRARTKVPRADRFERGEIRGRLVHRAQLRVPLDTNLFFCHGDTYAPAKSRNLSAGGLFLTADVSTEPGEPLTLYMPNLGGYDRLFETCAHVVWTTQKSASHRGMGLRFRDLDEDTMEQLDDFVVAYLRERLSKSNAITRRASRIEEVPTAG